jgi:hypothetical protein
MPFVIHIGQGLRSIVKGDVSLGLVPGWAASLIFEKHTAGIRHHCNNSKGRLGHHVEARNARQGGWRLICVFGGNRSLQSCCSQASDADVGGGQWYFSMPNALWEPPMLPSLFLAPPSAPCLPFPLPPHCLDAFDQMFFARLVPHGSSPPHPLSPLSSLPLPPVA